MPKTALRRQRQNRAQRAGRMPRYPPSMNSELWCDWEWDDPLAEANSLLAEVTAHIDELLAEIEGSS